MKRSIVTDAETTPLIYAINKKDRQLINFLLYRYDDEINVNLLNRPLVDTSPIVNFCLLNKDLFEMKINFNFVT